jgi:group I intron endonuclease
MKRKSTHFRHLIQNKHHSNKLQRAWNKYGKDKFNFEIIHKCCQKHLLKKEQYCLDFFKPEYNCTKNVLSPMLGKTHTNKTKKRMSQFHKGNKYNLGRKQPLSERKNRSEIRKKFRWSDEIKQKMSKTAKRINSINRIDRSKSYRAIYDNRGNHFKSMSEAAKFWNKSVQTICDILKGRHNKTKNGVIFYYEK